MKKQNQSNKTTFGSRLIGLALLATATFLILRWTAVIDWRWVWIFSPLWIVTAFNLVVGVVKDAIEDVKNWNDINRIR